MILNILLTGNKTKRHFNSTLNDLYKYLLKNYSHNIFIDKYVENSKLTFTYNSIHSKRIIYDMVVCIGGDGSILSAVRRMGNNQKPLLGIHIGNLGFLNQANKSNFKIKINFILNQSTINFNKFILLESIFTTKKKSFNKVLSLNDIVVTQSKISRLINLSAFSKKTLINKFACDGLIVSTPIGSTGYSLSAGGPIVSRDVNSFIITPISPHKLSASPIVINSNETLEIKFSKKYKNIYISSDGQETFEILDGSTIKIKKSKYSAKFIKVKSSNDYYLNLRDKLGW